MIIKSTPSHQNGKFEDGMSTDGYNTGDYPISSQHSVEYSSMTGSESSGVQHPPVISGHRTTTKNSDLKNSTRFDDFQDFTKSNFHINRNVTQSITKSDQNENQLKFSHQGGKGTRIPNIPTNEKGPQVSNQHELSKIKITWANKKSSSASISSESGVKSKLPDSHGPLQTLPMGSSKLSRVTTAIYDQSNQAKSSKKTWKIVLISSNVADHLSPKEYESAVTNQYANSNLETSIHQHGQKNSSNFTQTGMNDKSKYAKNSSGQSFQDESFESE